MFGITLQSDFNFTSQIRVSCLLYNVGFFLMLTLKIEKEKYNREVTMTSKTRLWMRIIK